MRIWHLLLKNNQGREFSASSPGRGQKERRFSFMRSGALFDRWFARGSLLGRSKRMRIFYASLPLTFLRTTSIHRRDRRSCRGYYRRRPFCRRKSFGRREGLPGKFLESVVVVKNDDFGNFFAAKSLRGIERKTTPRGFRIFERGGHRRGVCRRRGILYLKIFVGKGRPRRGSFRGSLGGLFGRIFRLLKVE